MLPEMDLANQHLQELRDQAAHARLARRARASRPRRGWSEFFGKSLRSTEVGAASAMRRENLV